MTGADHRIMFMALGFLAVILNDVPADKQALRATAIARLIESFCVTASPYAFSDDRLPYSQGATVSEQLFERYISELRETGSARLAFDRDTLFRMYEMLVILNHRDERKKFYASATDDVIANTVLEMTVKRDFGEQP